MNKYSVNGEAAVGTSKTVIYLFSTGTTRKLGIKDVVIGSDAAVADTATQFEMRYGTAVGTEGSGYTPVPLDPDTPAASSDCGVAHGVEPTYTASTTLLAMSVNQRATFRWVAADGYELIVNNVANEGIGLQSVSSTGTAVHQGTFLYEE